LKRTPFVWPGLVATKRLIWITLPIRELHPLVCETKMLND